MKLVKWFGNWADEFDTYGFIVVTNDEWDKLQSIIPKVKSGTEIGFGTNESWFFDGPEDILRDIEVVDISGLEIAILKKHFPTVYGKYQVSYGTHPFGSSIEDFRDRIEGFEEDGE
jgi:hypothetical protein